MEPALLTLTVKANEGYTVLTDTPNKPPENHMLTFGEKLRLARQDRGLTQAALADRAGISRNTVLDLERGPIDPRLSTVEKLLKALDLKSIDELDRF